MTAKKGKSNAESWRRRGKERRQEWGGKRDKTEKKEKKERAKRGEDREGRKKEDTRRPATTNCANHGFCLLPGRHDRRWRLLRGPASREMRRRPLFLLISRCLNVSVCHSQITPLPLPLQRLLILLEHVRHMLCTATVPGGTHCQVLSRSNDEERDDKPTT